MPNRGSSADANQEFARHLAAAIADSGLTLTQIRDRLANTGHNVSMASLSYWSTGRSVPTRSSSRQVVEALEGILGVDSGHLTQLLGRDTALQLTLASQRTERLRQLVAEQDFPTTADQQVLAVHLETEICPEVTHRTSTTTLVVRARKGGARGWSMALDMDGTEQVDTGSLFGLKPGRTMQVDEHTRLLEFLYDPPLEPGEARRTRHRTTFAGDQRDEHSLGYSVNRLVNLLTLTVEFRGALPLFAQHTFRSAEPGAAAEVVRVLTPAPTLEVVLPSPSPGLHSIQWGF